MQKKPAVNPELEAAYNVRLLRDDYEDLAADWIERSQQTRKNASVRLNCAYGSKDSNKLDIFYCGEPEAPLYVFIHGGYWQRGDKSIYSLISEPFLENGIDVAIVGYPLCPTVSMTELVDDVHQAVIWLYRNASELAISRYRINLSGHSAGGHLTAMLLARTQFQMQNKFPHNLIKSAIPFSGIYDLSPLQQTTISHALRLSEDEVVNLSPDQLDPSGRAPVLAIVGGTETDAFHQQTDVFLQRWKQQGIVVDKHVEPEADHFDLVNRLADSNSEMFIKIKHWLR
jgi:arylformamidase